MQLVNSKKSLLINKQLDDVLEDIVNNIAIASDFSIHHPNYQPFKLESEAIERFQQLPEPMQQKYLMLRLQDFLYRVYYNGSMPTLLESEATENNLPVDLENNTVLGVDVIFYQQLHESNYGDGYFQSGWLIVREESDGSLVVIKNDLKLHIQRDKHLQLKDKFAAIGDIVAIKMPKNLVQSGFYLAVGNGGGYRTLESEDKLSNSQLETQTTVRIYFNVTPPGAVVMMGSLTQKLNAVNIPFQLKFLYNPKDYKRHDSGVLYFDKQDYPAISQILSKIYLENQQYFKSETPLFTKQLAPGLALAEEPNQKFSDRESFGMNRCYIIASGLLAAWSGQDNSAQMRIQAIYKQFYRVGINLDRVHLNANSEDIYTFFDFNL